MVTKGYAKNIIVALDVDNQSAAIELARKLDPALCRLKVGKELFTSCGPDVVEKLHALNFDVFLDLKFHDIPNTVAKAVRAAAALGVWMVNVHASGGRAMMLAARKALGSSPDRPLLIGVTALTSMNAGDLLEVGFSHTPQQLVERLSILAHDCGLDGVVCSAMEAGLLKHMLGNDFLLVTPGIRAGESVADDQKRTMTPIQAIEAGSDFLVIGRPITQSSEPLTALQAIASQIT
jgi:orotidine-5'-phosphate decarboxylase